MGQINDSLYVGGNLSAQSWTLPSGQIVNDNVSGTAGITTEKMSHRFRATVPCTKVGVDAATEAHVAFVAGTAGTLNSFKAGAVVVAGAATTVTVDLKKNGTTVLSAVATLDNSQVAYQLVTATLSVTAIVAGDVFTVHFTLSGANEPQGVFAVMEADLLPT
jgi:hypothetical protein